MDPKVSKKQPFENVKVCPSRRCPTQSPDAIHFFVKIAVSQSKLARLTPNLGILWISVCYFWLCGSIVANPIIYRLVPSPSRFEIRQWCKYWTTCQNEHCYSEASSNTTSVEFENAALFLRFSVAGVSKNLREGIETGGSVKKIRSRGRGWGARRTSHFSPNFCSPQASSRGVLLRLPGFSLACSISAWKRKGNAGLLRRLAQAMYD